MPARGADAAAQRAAVAFFLHRHDARAEFFRDGLRTVGAAVVGDEDFAAHAGALDSEPRLLDAARERFRLVQARHQNGQFHGFAHAANLPKGRRFGEAFQSGLAGAGANFTRYQDS